MQQQQPSPLIEERGEGCRGRAWGVPPEPLLGGRRKPSIRRQLQRTEEYTWKLGEGLGAF